MKKPDIMGLLFAVAFFALLALSLIGGYLIAECTHPVIGAMCQ